MESLDLSPAALARLSDRELHAIEEALAPSNDGPHMDAVCREQERRAPLRRLRAELCTLTAQLMADPVLDCGRRIALALEVLADDTIDSPDFNIAGIGFALTEQAGVAREYADADDFGRPTSAQESRRIAEWLERFAALYITTSKALHR